MRAKELIGLTIAPPYKPECKSCDGPFNFASTYTKPRNMVVMAGVSMSHIPVSLTMATSDSNSFAYSRRKGSKLSLPDSSSPSKITVTGQGGPPAPFGPGCLASTIGCPCVFTRRDSNPHSFNMFEAHSPARRTSAAKAGSVLTLGMRKKSTNRSTPAGWLASVLASTLSICEWVEMLMMD